MSATVRLAATPPILIGCCGVYRVIHHRGDSLDLKTRTQSGRAELAPHSLRGYFAIVTFAATGELHRVRVEQVR